MAAYLHGSFGSGKSHYMAVLSLMLGNHPDVWAMPDFHVLRAKHEWLKQRQILRLHFNMIDADSIEQNVFGGYVRHVQANYPTAPLPALFADSNLLRDAQNLRQRMGDGPFFQGLNGGPTHLRRRHWLGQTQDRSSLGREPLRGVRGQP